MLKITDQIIRRRYIETTESEAIANKAPPFPGLEYLSSQPVEILPPHVEWYDRTVYWKRWAMKNTSA